MAMAPEPELAMAPAGVGLTGLDSYFWLSSGLSPITASAAAGPVTVVAEARPVQYNWAFGDGREKVTDHSGRRWTRRRAGNVTHLYESTGAYDMSVEVTWEARWRMGAGPWQHLGYFSNEDQVVYPVREMVSFLVRSA
jgi:PKD domain